MKNTRTSLCRRIRVEHLETDRAFSYSKAGVLARAQTVPASTVFSPLGLTLNEEQIPQVIGNNKNQGVR
jgi:hypothetical protein